MSVRNEQNKLETKVRRILENTPITRSNNDVLYVEVLKDIATEKGFNLGDMSFTRIMLFRKCMGFPPYESVTRARRKLQEQDETLRADDNVEAYRELREQEFKEWAVKN